MPRRKHCRNLPIVPVAVRIETVDINYAFSVHTTHTFLLRSVCILHTNSCCVQCAYYTHILVALLTENCSALNFTQWILVWRWINGIKWSAKLNVSGCRVSTYNPSCFFSDALNPTPLTELSDGLLFLVSVGRQQMPKLYNMSTVWHIIQFSTPMMAQQLFI